MNQIRTELIAKPERAIGRATDGFDVEVRSRQQTIGFDRRIDRNGSAAAHRRARIHVAIGDDGERHAIPRIAQCDIAFRGEVAQRFTREAIDGSDGAVFEIRTHRVHAQQRIVRVGFAAEAVIRHHQIRAVLRARQHGRETLHRLLVDERRDHTIAASGELSRRRSSGEAAAGQHCALEQFRGVCLRKRGAGDE